MSSKSELLFPHLHTVPPDIAPFVENPTAIVVSVSGGLDSDLAALRMREAYPDRRIILWHALLAGMDWPETQSHLDQLAEHIGNTDRVTVQAVYELTGGKTPTGFHSTRLRRIQDVTADGPATDNDPAAITGLLDFAARARNGMPPTKKLRYCTAYFKTQLFNAWLVRNRTHLGQRAVLATGERHAESHDRARLPDWEWRGEIGRSANFPEGWKIPWIRPVLRLRFHQVASRVIASGIDPHPGYLAQGETRQSMQDPWRDERGRPRLSCVCCIFTRGEHLRRARSNAPDSVLEPIAAVQEFEKLTGRSWRQDAFLDELMKEVSKPLPLFERE